MDTLIMNDLSSIIKREKTTNNILFMIKNITPEKEDKALEHGKYLYTLIRLFANTGFNLELEEPRYIDFTWEEAIYLLLDDIAVYSGIVKKNDSKITPILSELINIKIFILKHLLLEKGAVA